MTDFHEYLEILMRDGIQEAENLYAADRSDFTFPTAKAQWAPPRHYNIQQLRIEWSMDLKNEYVDAVSKLKIESIVPELKKVFLHAMELKIMHITDTKGNQLSFEMMPDEQVMSVDLQTPLKIVKTMRIF